jgi:hypothetical protein
VFRGEIAAREHQELLESALARDWQRAQALMTGHIQGCVEHALAEDNAGIFGSGTKTAAAKAGDIKTGDIKASGAKADKSAARAKRTRS